MGALNFEPRRARDFGPAALMTRLAVLGAIALVLAVYIWKVWPSMAPPATRPATAPALPLRPVPASLPALAEVDETVLAEVRDGEEVREGPFYFLLKRARDARQGAAGAREAPIPVDAETLRARPESFRGRLVRLRGLFLRDYLVDVPENLAGVRAVRQGELGTPAGAVLTFVLPNAAPIGARVGDDVELTGFFLQVRRFRSLENGSEQAGPLLIGVSLAGPNRRETVPVGWAAGLATSVLLVIGTVAVITLIRQRHHRSRRPPAPPPTAPRKRGG